MDEFTEQEKETIHEVIRRKFSKVAVNAEGHFNYPTGRAGLEALRYDPEMIRLLPEEAVASYCGVGNPFSAGSIAQGDHILDIGCGGGVDSMIAALMAGPTGRVVGIDLSPEMVARARQNLEKSGLENVSFHGPVNAENLPFPDKSFDAVISNGVFNLAPDKVKAVSEVFRVLKPDGRLMMADQVLVGELSQDRQSRIDNWAG
jgi:arsenite methyltransferase